VTDPLSRPCTSFAGMHMIARGPLVEVALAVKALEDEAHGTAILTFDDASGTVIDLDLRGSAAEIVARLMGRPGQDGSPGPAGIDQPARGRGRPKLGVVAREVTLLPRHWEWLSTQPGGASQALRRLVDEARRADDGRTEAKKARERAYRFMFALAGDLAGFEEASRWLFRGDMTALARQMAAWPGDVRAHVLRLARGDEEGATAR
jgi:hypothetical protein